MASATGTMLSAVCDFLSVTVIGFALILKLPQISTVVKQGSSKGLNLNSLLLEICSFTVLLTYQCGMGYPLTTYLEFCFLVPQDLILLLLVLKYNGQLSTRLIPLFVLYLAIAYSVAFRLVPDYVLSTSISLPLPLAMSSKVLQILTLLRTKDSGAVSTATWAMATYTACSRSITTLVQTGDLPVLTTYSVNTLLNATMTALCIMYRPKKKAD